SVASLGSYRTIQIGTLGKSNPLPFPWKAVQVLPPSVVLKRWPTAAGMKSAGSQAAAVGSAQFTALERMELLETSQVALASAPPRLAGLCGAAQSLPLPIHIVPVPMPVTLGMDTPCPAFTRVDPTPGLS